MEVKRELLERLMNILDSIQVYAQKKGFLIPREPIDELRAALSAPERKPMTLDEIKSNPVISYFGVDSGEKIVRAVEAFHKVKGTP